MFKKLLPLLFLFAGFQVNASIMYYTDRAAFLADVNAPLALEEFDDLVLEPGLTLSTGGGYSQIWTSPYCSGSCLGLIENSSTTFAFSPGVTAFGFDYAETDNGTLDYLDSNGNALIAALEQMFYPYGTLFFGAISSVDINWMHLGAGAADSGSVFFIDDLVFGNVTVPEPSVIALFGLGLVGIGFARRRRQS
jgi:hypothetical protein